MLFVGLLVVIVGAAAVLAGVKNLNVSNLFHGQFTKAG